MDYHFIVVFFQCCILYSVVSASNITVGPQTTDAFEGGNVTFYCTVQDLGGNTVVWRTVGLNIYSENRTIMAPDRLESDRYTITGDDADGTFNLEITGIITEFDNKKSYQCAIKGTDGVFFAFSGDAELLVYPMPPSPTCTVPRRNNDFVEGQNVEFVCTFESLLPKVEMNLTRNSNTLSSSIVDPNINLGRSTWSTTFSATSDDNGALLRCSVNHQILSMHKECSLTLNVSHTPIVTIHREEQSKLAFTAMYMSNPDATQFEWILYLGYTANDTIYLSNEKQLVFELRDSVPDEPVAIKDSGSNVQASEKPELSVLFSSIDNMTIIENKTIIQCSLKCSVFNSIGQGSDEHNTTCAIENGTIIIGKPEGQNSIKYYIIGGLSGLGTVSILICTIIIITLKNKTASVHGSVTDTQNRTPYSNNGYNDSVGNQEDNIYSENPITRDEKKEGNIPSKNFPESMPEKDSTVDAQERDTLPIDGVSQRKPEGDVAMNAGDGDAVAIPMGAAPLYSVINKPLKSSGRGNPAPDVLQS